MNVELSVHVPGAPDPDGHPRCEACGFRFPCPEVRMALVEPDADEWAVIELVGVGWTIWRRLPQGDQGWSEADPVGGVVVGWWDGDSGHRHYRCLDFPRGRYRYRILPAAEVDPAAAGLPNSATIRRHARKLARAVAEQKGVVSSRELELLADAVALLEAIA